VKRRVILVLAAVCVLSFLWLCSCASTGTRGETRTYIYYPNRYVYLDTARGTYFYMAGGVWKATAELPPHKTVAGMRGVTVRLATDKPYEHFHIHRVKFPPRRPRRRSWGGRR
jgi:hypothetical protein